MSKLRFTFTSLAIAALCGLPTVDAQQPEPAQVRNKQAQPNTQEGSRTDQTDRNQAEHSSDLATNQGPTVKEAILKMLQKANEGEIEIAQLAIQKSDNEDVKQLAQMIAQDHQACNQKLQQMTGVHAQTSQSGDRRSVQGQPDQKNDVQQSGNTPSGEHALAKVPQQLCEITEQACDTSLKMTKEMLGQHEGQDFNMAFLGQQCVAHMMMLAELKAIESVGPQELQQVAQEASEKVEQHLRKTKELAKKLEDDRENDSKTDRS